jgi:hypothetical protein
MNRKKIKLDGQTEVKRVIGNNLTMGHVIKRDDNDYQEFSEMR